MSDLTPCNLCNLRSLKASAMRSGQKLHRRSAERGVELVIAPAGAADPWERDERGNLRHFAAWMAEIPAECCCGRNTPEPRRRATDPR